MIEVGDLHKRFGVVHAVDGLGLRARDGEITGLIGPNGAGKTTTFRMISGLLLPDAGTICVDGHDVVADRLAVQRRLGVLPDVRGLYPRLTAREHIRYYGNLHGLRGRRLEVRVEEVVREVEMGSFADRYAFGFSRGEQLKVALARALVHAPPNLILDEPTNGLDVMASRAMRREIRRLRDAGHCILLSSHIMAEVSALCDKLFIMSDGRAIAEGSLDELKSRTGTTDLEETFISVLRPASAAQ